jgi:hypothetical protein
MYQKVNDNKCNNIKVPVEFLFYCGIANLRFSPWNHLRMDLKR